jgi:hypothetical protein
MEDVGHRTAITRERVDHALIYLNVSHEKLGFVFPESAIEFARRRFSFQGTHHVLHGEF